MAGKNSLPVAITTANLPHIPRWCQVSISANEYPCLDRPYTAPSIYTNVHLHSAICLLIPPAVQRNLSSIFNNMLH